MRQYTVVLLLLTATVVKSFRPKHPVAGFYDLDTDNDGLLGEQEVQAHLKARFQREVAALVQFFDSDANGVISKEEYDKRASEFFRTDQMMKSWFWNSVDLDSNGETDAEEMESQQSLILTASSQELSRQWLQKFDTDGDHEISKEEYLAVEDNSGPDAFDGMDLDHDGLLSAMEYLHSGAAFGKASTFLESVDNDGDGGISSVEWSKLHTEL